MGRSPCCDKEGLNRGAWTREEDGKLVEYITAHGEGSWRTLPKAAGLLRCGKSCRLRWINYLRPDLKRGNITEEEDGLIIRLHAMVGNRWSLIAARLPGRTDNEIKNYWNTHLKKKLKRMKMGGIDPRTSQNKAAAAVLSQQQAQQMGIFAALPNYNYASSSSSTSSAATAACAGGRRRRGRKPRAARDSEEKLQSTDGGGIGRRRRPRAAAEAAGGGRGGGGRRHYARNAAADDDHCNNNNNEEEQRSNNNSNPAAAAGNTSLMMMTPPAPLPYFAGSFAGNAAAAIPPLPFLSRPPPPPPLHLLPVLPSAASSSVLHFLDHHLPRSASIASPLRRPSLNSAATELIMSSPAPNFFSSNNNPDPSQFNANASSSSSSSPAPPDPPPQQQQPPLLPPPAIAAPIASRAAGYPSHNCGFLCPPLFNAHRSTHVDDDVHNIDGRHGIDLESSSGMGRAASEAADDGDDGDRRSASHGHAIMQQPGEDHHLQEMSIVMMSTSTSTATAADTSTYTGAGVVVVGGHHVQQQLQLQGLLESDLIWDLDMALHHPSAATYTVEADQQQQQDLNNILQFTLWGARYHI